MPAIPKVLIVEDDEFWQGIYAKEIGDKVEIIGAFTREEAERFFEAHPDLSAIVMDGCIGDVEEPNTGRLVVKFRQTFKGPIIAASGNGSFRKVLLATGCSHESTKDLLSKKVIEVLGL